ATTGWWLAARRSTATAQPECNIYSAPITTAIAPNPNANKANAAKSSRTKYSCIAPITPRNHHIHLRLLSLIFILSSVLGPVSLLPLTGTDLWLSRIYLGFLFSLLLDAATCPVGLPCCLPVPLDSYSAAETMVRRTHFCL